MQNVLAPEVDAEDAGARDREFVGTFSSPGAEFGSRLLFLERKMRYRLRLL